MRKFFFEIMRGLDRENYFCGHVIYHIETTMQKSMNKMK